MPHNFVDKLADLNCTLLTVLGLLFPFTAAAHESHDRTQPPWQEASEWPDRIVVTMPSDPATSFAVTWRTNTSVPVTWGQFAPATSDARFDLAAKTVKAKTTLVQLDHVPHKMGRVPVVHNQGLPRVFYHTATFNNLKPDTFYAYRVRGATGKFSPWRQVKTAPENGPLKILFFGDAQRGIRSHVTRIFDMATRVASDAHFALHAGDLVNTAMYDQEWAEWFDAVGNIHRVTPIVPVAGNHDYMNFGGTKLFASTDKRVSPLWRPQFSLPVVSELPEDLHETVYDLRYTQDLHVFVLDSSGVAFEKQLEWLESKLQSTTARWRIVSMHHPIFSFVGGHEHPSHRQRRLRLVQTLENHDIDLVLCGHRHTYQRGEFGKDVARFAIGKPHQVRTVFVVTASCAARGTTKVAGWERYSEEQNGSFGLVRHADNTPLFATIGIEGRKLDFVVYDAVGEVYDSFTIEKSSDEHETKQIINGQSAQAPIKSYDNTGPYRDWNDLRQ